MEISFLVGNGFDRALGLNTSYSSFYEWYVKQKPEPDEEEHIKQFRDEIDEYVRKTENANPYWADAERGLGKYTEKFSSEEVDKFIECYEDLRDKLVTYLQIQDSKVEDLPTHKLYEIIKTQIINMISNVDEVERGPMLQLISSSNTSEHYFNFISFNYTKALDALYTHMKSIDSGVMGHWSRTNGTSSRLKVGTLIHAHGYLDEYPILGVCNSSLVSNRSFWDNEDFLAVMKKSQSIREAGKLWRSNVQQTVKRSTIVCVFGMSLGESDDDYWEMLSTWLNDNPNRHLIVFWRNSELRNINISVAQKRQEKKKVYGRFFENSAITSESFEKLKRRIHVVINCKDMFCFPKELQIQSERNIESEDKHALLAI